MGCPKISFVWGRAYVKSRDPCDVAFSPAIVPGHRVFPKCKFSSRCWQKGLLKTNMDPEATASAVLSTSPSVSRTCDLQQLPPFYRPPPATASAVLSTSPSVSRTCDLRFDPTRAGVSTTGAEEVSARGGNPTTLRALATSALRCVPQTDISPVLGSGRVCVRGQSRQIHHFSMNKMAVCECLPLVEA